LISVVLILHLNVTSVEVKRFTAIMDVLTKTVNQLIN